MQYTSRLCHMEREEEIEKKYEGTAWWPLFALIGILGGLLLWEDLNPLTLLPAPAIGLVTLTLLYGGVCIWLVLIAKE